MDQENNLAFTMGQPERAYPLGRFLPALSAGSTATWLRDHIAPGSWVLDPFGSHPGVMVEAAQAGYRVLAASNNPILTLMVEAIASAPERSQFQPVVAELAASRRGAERLETVIQSLYASPCPGCGRMTQVQAYLWRSGEEKPFARLIKCRECGIEGEYSLTPADTDHLRLPGSAALSQARAMERVMVGDEETRETIQKALEVYPTRALYVLSTLINKMDGLEISAEQKLLLTALLVSVCDECNTLWSWPGSRLRPRQLTIPPQYRENNPWLALENAVELWGTLNHKPVPVTRWPELPPESGGICLYPGRVRTLFPLSQDIPFKAVISRLPRPNQAFWTLSAIWSGWLWGREAVLPLKSALERRRYDWTWHLSALHQAFLTINQSIPAEIPFLAALPEVNAGFLSAVVGAGQLAGMDITGLALCRDLEEAQVTWLTGKYPAVQPSRGQDESARTAIREYLIKRGEPASYLQLYTSAWLGMTREGHIPRGVEQAPTDLIVQKQGVIHKALGEPHWFQRVGSAGTSLETGWWDLMDVQGADVPLADRVEVAVVRLLHSRSAIPQSELMMEMFRRFPGLYTPAIDLILACLQSYALLEPGEPPRWTLQEQEAASVRTRQLQAALKMLTQIGERMGYVCNLLPQQGEGEIKSPLTLTWTLPTGEVQESFYLMASSLISRCISAPASAYRQVVVLPGSRANLLTFKLRRDQRLAKNAQNWHFLKFRHLRHLAEQPGMTVDLWSQLLDADPPRWEEATQMTFF